jgi:hypothetical protein
MISNRVVVAVMTVIVAGFLAIGTLYALRTPEWQSPDEPAHYNYAAQVATKGCCPVLQPGDWDAAKLEQLKSEGFPEGADVSAIQYEDHQPPAFYLLASLVFTVSRGSLLALRLLSLAIGAGVIVAVYTALARLLPYHKPVALAGAAFVAFLPEYIAISASANNDSLSILVVSILAVSALTYLGNPVLSDRKGKVLPLDEARRPHAAALGGITGVAYLTKLTIYLPSVVLVAVAVLLRWRIERRSVRWLFAQIGWSAGMSIAFGLPWWAHNASVYGWPDIFGLQRHDAVVVGQPRTADLVSKVGMGEYLRDYVTTVYHSSIGQFGWMGVPMPDKFYLGVGLFLLFSLAGLILLTRVGLAVRRFPMVAEPPQRAGVWALVGLSLASIAGLVEYNFTFQQFQGRYLFPMLTPFAGVVAAGLHGWAKTIGGWLKNDAISRWLDWLPLALLAWMPALALWALFKFIVPNLR